MHELQLLREERVRERERVTEERSRWQQEKESVLRYQRQLQLACTHAQRTNRRLHQEIERLNGVNIQIIRIRNVRYQQSSEMLYSIWP